MSTIAAVDPNTVEAFTNRVFQDASAALVMTMAALGDRLGLFKTLATEASFTSEELATRAGIHERYAREWLGAMASAGYVAYEPSTKRFALPPEHAPALSEENGPAFFGGVFEMYLAMPSVFERLAEAFRIGGGVPQSAYDPRYWEGMERFSAGWVENLLVPQWIPAMPEVQALLGRGADVADIGCGSGRALIKLAQAFPQSRYVGYDAFAPVVERATANAKAAGVSDRVQFEVRDAALELPRQFDVITTFDVLHDAADPIGVLKAIRHGLAPDGVHVCLEMNCAENLEDNLGPRGALFHSISVLYCMTTSLANHGMGLGTLGLYERKLRELAAVVGFGEVRRVPIDDPFNILYELRPSPVARATR